MFSYKDIWILWIVFIIFGFIIKEKYKINSIKIKKSNINIYKTTVDWSEYINTHPYIEKEKELEQRIIYNNFFKIHKINNKKLNILEIGAGHGIYTVLFSKMFKSITAIEPNKILYKGLKDKLKKR